MDKKVLLTKKQTLLNFLKDGVQLGRELQDGGEVDSFQIKYKSLKVVVPQLDSIFNELAELASVKKNNVPDQTNDYLEFLDLQGEVEHWYQKYCTQPVSVAVTFPKIKLPPIEIQSFNGEQQNWKLFYESFNSLIHNNNELSNLQKVQYLISKLQGKAAKVVSGIDISAENYPILWNTLISKYEDPRSLASQCLNKILQHKSIKTEALDNLNHFLEHFCTSVEAMRNLQMENLEDFILLNLALSKLPSDTVKAFEVAQAEKAGIPTLKNLKDFVQNQVKALERCSQAVSKGPGPSHYKAQNHQSVTKSHTFLVKDEKCICCHNDKHPLYRCTKFLEMKPQQRYEVVKRNNICVNCLNNKHLAKNCTSEHGCAKCGKKHNTTLHFETSDGDLVQQRKSQPEDKTNFVRSSETLPRNNKVAMCSTTNTSEVLLATAKVRVMDSHGNSKIGRFLLDSGSQSSFLTKRFCEEMGLQITKPKVSHQITGMESMSCSVLGKVDGLLIESLHTGMTYNLDPLVVKDITDRLPTVEICQKQLKECQLLPLADDTFGIPGKVDGLIGGALYPRILLPDQVEVTNGPIAINTTLGYVIMGEACATNSSNKSFCGFVKNQQLEKLVQKMWEVEDVPSVVPLLSQDEQEAENHFRETHSFNPEKRRYICKIPFKQESSQLGLSHDIAKRRFLSLEKKLVNNPSLKERYKNSVDELLAAEQLEPVVEDDVNTGYYVPYHMITKEQSLSTKFRIVYDFSCTTDNGVSLNNIVHSGPKLHQNLFHILLNFRLFPVAMIADIAKMYHQILLHPEDTVFQKIFWREEPHLPLGVFKLTRVTFGLKASPYLAQRVIRQLASDKHKEYPLAKDIIDSSFYMDDLTLSLPNVKQALEVQKQLCQCFQSASFDLVKWASNNHQLLGSIPEESQVANWNSDDSLKILGMSWNNFSDHFTFSVAVEKSVCTKRNVLSNLAKIWDPMGLIAPVTVYCKILLQSLWSLELDWDHPAPDESRIRWDQVLEELKLLSNVQIPRHISLMDGGKLTLVGFCDSSEKASAAVVYSRVQSKNGDVTVTLLCSKSRLAPLKKISIPRLELNSALLLARLISSVYQQYSDRYPVEEMYCLSDSTVALHWILGSPHKWQTFVANRVTKIQDLVAPTSWYHVTTDNNASADCLSRGLLPSELLQHTAWFTGPSYLSQDITTWPITTIGTPTAPLPEEKKVVLVSVALKENFLLDIAKKFSSWTKILRILVVVFRFLKKLPMRTQINIEDLKFAEIKLLLAVQDKSFGKNFQKEYASLSPFRDDTGLIRVGGRLSNSSLPFENKHPVLLPKNEHVVELLVTHVHEKNFHTGPSLLLSIVRQNYWIIAARPLVRKVTLSCNFCFRFQPKNIYPLMSDLPKFRIEEVKPFLNTGLDFAGPYTITLSKHRGVKSQKSYLCLFVCLATKAVHLELVSDLSKDAFLNTLKRFLARRGPIATLWSDNGSNFIGSKNHLNDVYKLMSSSNMSEALHNELVNHQIEWKMIPPSAPHMGGIWERGVRSCKSLIQKVIGEQILTYEELSTVFAQVEALLNSRPLCVLSSDPNELETLTPAHFVNLTPLHHLPAVDVTSIESNRLTRFKLLDKLVQSFWKRWRLEYLNTLQEKSKWRTDTPNIQIGTVVLIKEENTPPLQWPIGIVVEVFPSHSDNKIRVVNVKTKTGLYKRPVVKLCPLPTQ